MKFWEAMRELENGKKVSPCSINMPIDKEILSKDICCSALTYWDEEWELYEEPVKTYTFQEIIPFLKQGKKVKRRNSHPYDILYLDVDGDLCHYFPKLEDLEAIDWVVYD